MLVSELSVERVSLGCQNLEPVQITGSTLPPDFRTIVTWKESGILSSKQNYPKTCGVYPLKGQELVFITTTCIYSCFAISLSFLLSYPIIYGILVTSASATLHLPLTYMKTYNTNMNNKARNKKKCQQCLFLSFFFF